MTCLCSITTQTHRDRVGIHRGTLWIHQKPLLSDFHLDPRSSIFMRRFIILICFWISLDGLCFIATLSSLIYQGFWNPRIQEVWLTEALPIEIEIGDGLKWEN